MPGHTKPRAKRMNLAVGKAVLPWSVDKADYILCLEADPFGNGLLKPESMAGFGQNRHVKNNKLNKLVQASIVEQRLRHPMPTNNSA